MGGEKKEGQEGNVNGGGRGTSGHSLSRQTPGPWEKVEIFREHLEHAAHIPGQQVLAADFGHPWEVIDFLRGKQECMNNGPPGGPQELPRGKSSKGGAPQRRRHASTEDQP